MTVPDCVIDRMDRADIVELLARARDALRDGCHSARATVEACEAALARRNPPPPPTLINGRNAF